MAVPFDPSLHCGAHPGADRGPCRATKGRGTPHPGWGHCKHHGGSTPSGIAHAERERTRALAARWALPLDIDPATALLDEVRRSAGIVAWLQQQVTRLIQGDPNDPDAVPDVDRLVRGTRFVRRREVYERDPDTGQQVPTGEVEQVSEVGPGVHHWWAMLAAERKHLAAVARDAVHAGVAQQRVAIEEAQGELLGQALSVAARQVDVDPDVMERLVAALGEQLEALAGEGAVVGRPELFRQRAVGR